jgi:hypothetical protein
MEQFCHLLAGQIVRLQTAAWAFGINVLAGLIDIASKLGSHNLYLIVVQKQRGTD